ncbi:MAG: sugar-binding protein [Prolixibacteraceae bacterium]
MEHIWGKQTERHKLGKYVLVEVTDDMLSDDHAIPTQSWWDDDCLEVIINEDRSG